MKISPEEYATLQQRRKPKAAPRQPVAQTTLHTIAGLDPGASTGVCFLTRDKSCEWQTLDFWGAFWRLYRHYDRDSTLIVIEQGGLNKRVFHRQAENWGAIAATGLRVGGANKEAELLAQGLEEAGFTIVRVKPETTKWSAKMMKEITGLTGRSNSHERDAVKLAWLYKHLLEKHI